MAAALADTLPGVAVARHTGAGKSGIHLDGYFASVGREEITAAVRKHEIRLLVATDAACEGLDLQTLGTMINVDLPCKSLVPRAADWPHQALRSATKKRRHAEPSQSRHFN